MRKANIGGPEFRTDSAMLNVPKFPITLIFPGIDMYASKNTTNGRRVGGWAS